MISRQLAGVVAKEVYAMLDRIRDTEEYNKEVDWWWPDGGDGLIADLVVNGINLIVDASIFAEEQSV